MDYLRRQIRKKSEKQNFKQVYSRVFGQSRPLLSRATSSQGIWTLWQYFPWSS